MADWSRPFTASYRLVRVSRSTLLEVGTLPNAVLAGSTITRNVDTADYESATIRMVGSVGVGSDLVRVYLDATFEDGTTEHVALGTFMVETPSRDVSGPLSEWSAKLVGRLAEAREDEFERPVTIPAGSNAVEEASAILQGCGIEVVADESDWVLDSDWVVGMGGVTDEPTDKLGVANKLLDLAGFASAITDGMGRALLRKYRDPSDRNPSHTFAEGPLARFLSEAEDERDVSDVANVVVVVYGTQDAETIGVAYDDDPRSPYSTATLGRRKVKRYSYQDGATQAQADAKAAELLRTQQSVIHRVTLSHVYAPVTCTDVVGVEWPTAGISDTFAIRTQSIQLGAGCLTKSELRRFERGY